MGEVSTIIGGGTPKTAESTYFGSDIPWITPADLSDYTDKFISYGARSLTKSGLANSGARLMPAGTVLFSSRAPIGYVAIASRPVSTNQGFKSFVLNEDLFPDYVYYWLQCAKPFALALASGTTFLEISGKKAADIPIPIPPLAEQRRIVAEIEEQLSRLEAGVTALKRVQVNLERYRASVLGAAVIGLLSAGTTRKWQRATIGDLAEEVRYGTSAKTSSDLVDGIPVLRMGNIEHGTLVIDKLKFLPSDHEEFPDLLLRSGDLLFNRTNSSELVGKSAVYRGIPQECSFASYLIRVRFGSRVLPDFANAYLNSSFGRAWVSRVVSQQVGQANVNGSKLKALEIPLPPLEEQRQIVTEVEQRLSVVEKTEAQAQSDLARAERLRQAVLATAFAP